MSKIALSANNNGTGIFTIASPSSNTNQTITLSDLSGSAVINEGNSIFKINSAGNVGIGTATPTERLHIATEGGLNANDALLRLGNVDSFNSFLLGYYGTGDVTDDAPAIYTGSSSSATGQAGHIAYKARSGASPRNHIFYTGATPTERMRISANGNVGIGTTDPNYQLTIQGTGQETANLTDAGNKGGSLYLKATAVGSGSGGAVLFGTTFSNQTPFAAIKGFVTDGATNTIGRLVFSTRNAVGDTSLTERMLIDPAGLITQLNATSGQGAIVGEQTFRLAANGSALGPAIADFFGTTSSISLEASSVYQITAYCVFTKTTAGTITWTMTASSAPTRMVGTYISSPNAGITAGVTNTGFTGSQGATTAAFAVTNSLTTAVNHAFQITMQVQTNAATNWRLKITNSAGTATPLAGSYYTVKKISTSTGTFV